MHGMRGRRKTSYDGLAKRKKVGRLLSKRQGHESERKNTYKDDFVYHDHLNFKVILTDNE